MLYAVDFIGLFASGGLTDVFLASLGLDIQFTETRLVVSRFHYMVGGTLMAFLGAANSLLAELSRAVGS